LRTLAIKARQCKWPKTAVLLVFVEIMIVLSEKTPWRVTVRGEHTYYVPMSLERVDSELGCCVAKEEAEIPVKSPVQFEEGDWQKGLMRGKASKVEVATRDVR